MPDSLNAYLVLTIHAARLHISIYGEALFHVQLLHCGYVAIPCRLDSGHGQFYMACIDSVRAWHILSGHIRLVGTAVTCQGCQMGDKVSHSVSACVQVQLAKENKNPEHKLIRCVAPPTTYLGIRSEVLQNFHPLISAQIEETPRKKKIHEKEGVIFMGALEISLKLSI